MNYLAINTSGRFEILLVSGAKEFYFSSDEKRLASTELFPAIRRLLDEASLKPKDIDAFGCVIGPGSFTGIRIGVSAVRAMCYALKKPAVPVTAFDVLAYNNTAKNVRPCAAVIDGGGGVCYLKNYGLDGVESAEPVCLRHEDLPLHAHGKIVAESNFLKLNGAVIAKKDQSGLSNAFRAALGRGAGDYSLLVPLYLRRPQAEREDGEL